VARYRDSICRLCRREGMKLFLKGERCFKESCAFEKRGWAPGQHGRDRRPKMLGYGLQLREKQKVKRLYGILENQFRNYFSKAERQKGITGENLLIMLERRLDNVVYRIGFSTSRAQARQLVRHGHIRINGRKVNVPSYIIRSGDMITLKEKTKKNAGVQYALQSAPGRGTLPAWLSVTADQAMGTVVSLPTRDDIQFPIEEQLIVELYSK
jgi:small subunit ribosomal protein S4